MAPWPLPNVVDRILKLGSEKEDSKEVDEHGVPGTSNVLTELLDVS